MTITNGTVEYARTTRPADFESKQAKVVLSFTVEDGSNPTHVVSEVFDMAVGEVHRRLGLRTDSVTVAPAAAEETGFNSPPSTKKRAKAPPAEVPVADPTESAASFPPGSTATESTPAADDPAAIGEPEAAEPVVYTDKQLRDAVNYAVGEKKVASARIVALIIEFTNPPGTPEGERVPGKNIPMIEQDRRGEFLARLKALYEPADGV